MTNYESIKQGKHKGFNELLKKSSTYAIAEMLSTIDCSECICRTYCRKYVCESCQEIIKNWLIKEKKNDNRNI